MSAILPARAIGLPARATELTADVFWRVENGAVDVFLAPSSEIQDRLHPLASLEPGSLIGGIRPTTTGRAQVSMASLGASLDELDRDATARLPYAAEALTPWLTGLLAAGQSALPPRTFTPGIAGQSVALTEGQALRPIDKLAVVTVLSGTVMLHGDINVQLTPGHAVLVREDDWVTALTGAVVKSQDLAAALTTPGGWDLLAVMAARALNDAEERVTLARVSEATRVRKRQSLDDRGADLPDRLLEALLGNRDDIDDLAEQSDGEVDATFAAAQIVARAAGWSLSVPPATRQPRVSIHCKQLHMPPGSAYGPYASSQTGGTRSPIPWSANSRKTGDQWPSFLIAAGSKCATRPTAASYD